MEPHTSMESGTKQSPLLSLPPEIRNLIYGYTALRPGKLAINHDTIAAPALACVCRQTRHEYLSFFRASRFTRVSIIRALVYDFDFRPLAQLLMRTSDSEGHARATNCKLWVTIIAKDADTMKSHHKIVSTWRESLSKGVLGRFNCQYEVQVDYDALGSRGLEDLVEVLALLRHRSDPSLLRLASSSSPLEKGLAKKLDSQGIESHCWSTYGRWS